MVGQLAKKFYIIWKRKCNWLVQSSALSNPIVICLNPVYIVILCVPMLPFNVILIYAHVSLIVPFLHFSWLTHVELSPSYSFVLHAHPLIFSDVLIPFPVIKSKALVISLLIFNSLQTYL